MEHFSKCHFAPLELKTSSWSACFCCVLVFKSLLGFAPIYLSDFSILVPSLGQSGQLVGLWLLFPNLHLLLSFDIIGISSEKKTNLTGTINLTVSPDGFAAKICQLLSFLSSLAGCCSMKQQWYWLIGYQGPFDSLLLMFQSAPVSLNKYLCFCQCVTH